MCVPSLSDPSYARFFQNNFIASTKNLAAWARAIERTDINLSVHKTRVGRRVGAFTIDKIILSEYNALVDSRAAPGEFLFFSFAVLFSLADRDHDFIVMHSAQSRLARAPRDLLKSAAPANKRIEPYAIHNSRSTNSMSIMDRQYPSTV